ncbi:MAG: hypothetical protein SO435_07110 [Peptostreptococcus porci]|nr:hypothetical protein [Peptostreptococcus porci]
MNDDFPNKLILNIIQIGKSVYENGIYPVESFNKYFAKKVPIINIAFIFLIVLLSNKREKSFIRDKINTA